MIERTYRIDGINYRWNGWAGCQLESIEWRKPDPFEPRYILRQRFYPFSVTRCLFRWRVTWTLSDSAIDYDRLRKIVREFRAELNSATW